jgi:hypothetical protein
MAQWQRKIDLTEVWATEDVNLIASTVAERLRALEPFNDSELDSTAAELADEFTFLAADPHATADDLDDLMDELYDWGDITLDNQVFNGKKVCWIATFA